MADSPSTPEITHTTAALDAAASCTCRPGDPLATCAAYLAASADPTPTTEADDA